MVTKIQEFSGYNAREFSPMKPASGNAIRIADFFRQRFFGFHSS
jgi:hypothetical protein